MKNEQNKILNVAALLFLGIAVLVMFFQYVASPGYKASNLDMLGEAGNAERWILPHELNTLIENDKLQNYLIVDLRQREEFNRGSLPGAINIPFEQLLDKKSLKQFKTRKPILLFSGKESQASTAGLLLYGKGFDKALVLANDYSYLKENVLEKFHPSVAFTRDEKARYDYHRFLKAAPRPAATPAATQPKIIETQVISIEGGC
jgi:rhodanese-related sulfurtransferase